MKNGKFKCIWIILSLLAAAFATNTWAEDLTKGFMEQCAKRKLDPACCEATLKKYSDSYRDMVKRDLPKLDESTKKKLTKIMANPGMTLEKIDAVCSLYDASREHEWLAKLAGGAGDKKGYKEHKDQLNQLSRQSRELAQSYNSETLNGNDIQFYCMDRNKLYQMEKDLKEDDGKLYPLVKRQLKSNDPHDIYMIFRYDLFSKCRKKRGH